MTRSLFGTDGVRGLANSPPMSPETILSLAKAAGQFFTRGDHRHLVVIGKDTRLSGYMLEPALVAGFISQGMDVILVGPMPTPGVAMLTRSLRADLGVMISASHNPFEDNGIKFFGPDGCKLSDECERTIEALMASSPAPNPTGSGLGRAKRLEDATGRYSEYVKSTLPKGFRLDGLKIVVDCAHGAAYKIAPAVLWELGAEIIPLGVTPNGTNINDACGATAPESLCHAVVENAADIGLALDGDADRLIVVDEKGRVIDGDQIMATIALELRKSAQLAHNTLVATVMSNGGLEAFLKEQGITLLRTQVGDRYVSAAMMAGGYNLGGEQSGHIILSDHATTGDGLVAGLQVLKALKASGKPASQALYHYTPMPQKLINIKLKARPNLEDPIHRKAIGHGETLIPGGRLLVRLSGTEPLIRLMAESHSLEEIDASLTYLTDHFK